MAVWHGGVVGALTEAAGEASGNNTHTTIIAGCFAVAAALAVPLYNSVADRFWRKPTVDHEAARIEELHELAEVQRKALDLLEENNRLKVESLRRRRDRN